MVLIIASFIIVLLKLFFDVYYLSEPHLSQVALSLSHWYRQQQSDVGSHTHEEGWREIYRYLQKQRR
jgi:hypothetical protein